MNRITRSTPLASRVRYLVPGGSARRVLDFAELTSVGAQGRLLVGHTAAADPDAPVLVEIVVEPGGALAVDATCPSCPASSQIGPLDGDTLVLVEHRPGCAHLAVLARRAGLAS